MPHGDDKSDGRLLEPALLTLDISSYKFFVRFGEVDNAFDDTDDIT